MEVAPSQLNLALSKGPKKKRKYGKFFRRITTQRKFGREEKIGVFLTPLTP